MNTCISYLLVVLAVTSFVVAAPQCDCGRLGSGGGPVFSLSGSSRGNHLVCSHVRGSPEPVRPRSRSGPYYVVDQPIRSSPSRGSGPVHSSPSGSGGRSYLVKEIPHQHEQQSAPVGTPVQMVLTSGPASAPAPGPTFVQAAPAPAPAPTFVQAAPAPAPAPTYVQAAPAPAPTYVQAAPAPAPTYVQAAPAPAPTYVQAAPAPQSVQIVAAAPAQAPASVQTILSSGTPVQTWPSGGSGTVTRTYIAAAGPSRRTFGPGSGLARRGPSIPIRVVMSRPKPVIAEPRLVVDDSCPIHGSSGGSGGDYQDDGDDDSDSEECTCSKK